jgi:hypothetical protein
LPPDDFESPREIPWRFIATTAAESNIPFSSRKGSSSPKGSSSQKYTGNPENTNGEPSPSLSTISLFNYSPPEVEYANLYPNERLLFFKIPVSLCSDVNYLLSDNNVLGIFDDNYPIWTSIIDVHLTQITNPDIMSIPSTSCYFISAVPSRREILETGFAGRDIIEGESSSLAIGKSLSQMKETSNTSSETKSWYADLGLDIGFISFGGGGAGGSRTDVSSNVNRVQRTDNMQRNASEERKELESYHSNISNTLTILNSKYMGTPYLQFVLRPRPLHVINYDPTDPYIWYSEFLRRRSRGLEGIQDFFAVAGMHKNLRKVCIDITLKNVYIIDAIPTYPQMTDVTADDIVAIYDYLFTIYPRGTPIDDLDFDFTKDIERHWGNDVAEIIRNPIVIDWEAREDKGLDPPQWIFGPYILCPGDFPMKSPSTGVVRPTKPKTPEIYDPSGPMPEEEREPDDTTKTKAKTKTKQTIYKHDYADWSWFHYKSAAQLKLELLKYNYLRSLRLSPLERGVIFYLAHNLRVCIEIGQDNVIRTTSAPRKSIGKPIKLSKKTNFNEISNLFDEFTEKDTKSPVSDAIKWNYLENTLPSLVTNELDKQTLSLTDSDVMGLTVTKWSALPAGASRNARIQNIARSLGLKKAVSSQLSKYNVTNLKQLGNIISNIDVYKNSRARLSKYFEAPDTTSSRLAKEKAIPEISNIQALVFRYLQKNLERTLRKEVFSSRGVKIQ